MPHKPRIERITAEQVYNFYRDFISENGLCPTVREAAAHFKIVPSNVQYHLSRLELAGCIKRNRGFSRSIELTDRPYSKFRAIEENRWRHDLLDFLEGKPHVTIEDLRRRFTSNTNK